MITVRSALALGACLALVGACGGKNDQEEVQASPQEQYCTEVAAACSAANAQAQYPAHGNIACLAYAEQAAGFTLGVVGTSSGNTLECRRTHARLALGDAAHCVQAGPSGGNVCGTWCENYCALALRNCAGVNAIYADTAACLALCAGFPTNGPWDRMSNSVQCRIMEAAEASIDPVQHCPHAAVTSTVCL